MNAARSNYGRMGLPKSFVETIAHKEPVLTIAATSEDQRGETKTFMKLTTDGREALNEINGNEFRSKSRWDTGKLVTMVTGDERNVDGGSAVSIRGWKIANRGDLHGLHARRAANGSGDGTGQVIERLARSG